MTTNNELTAETVTDEQINALRAEAIAADDRKMADVCTAALGTDEAGYPVVVTSPSGRIRMRKLCAEAINNARAQADAS